MVHDSWFLIHGFMIDIDIDIDIEMKIDERII